MATYIHIGDYINLETATTDYAPPEPRLYYRDEEPKNIHEFLKMALLDNSVSTKPFWNVHIGYSTIHPHFIDNTEDYY